jgi:hypothetical protein
MSRWTLSLVVFALAAVSQAQITLGQSDDFQDGTFMNWASGNVMTNVATGGPTGAGDRFLQLESTGGLGAGGRLAMFNGSQWFGDWIAAGVTAVSGWFRNFGATDVHLRLVFHDMDDLVTRWTSTQAQVVPAGSGWTFLTFSTLEQDLTRVLGNASYNATMVDVDRFMFRHQTGAPAAEGTPIATTFGFDELLATTLDTTVIVGPTDYTVMVGSETSHNLSAFLQSDDVRHIVSSSTINSSTTTIEYVATAPEMTVNRLSFILECHANDPARQRNIDLWNYTTNQWETVSTTLGTTSDSTVQVDITVNPGRFIHGTSREMKARTRLISAVIPRTWPRVSDLYDLTVWELSSSASRMMR